MASVLNRINGYLRHDTTTGIQLHEMDAFRGWAALGVLLLHCAASAGRWRYFMHDAGVMGRIFIWPIWSGWAGLDLFFFISGFLLFIKFGKAYYEDKDSPDKAGFYLRRYKRIAPAFYANLIVLFILSGTWIIDPVNPDRSPVNIVLHLLFMHNLSQEHIASINVVFWTLAIEAQFYIVLPFIASWFYGKRWIIGLLSVLAASAIYKVGVTHLYYASDVLRAGMPPFNMLVPFSQLIWRIDEFAIGMCFANLWLYVNTPGNGLSFLTHKRFANLMVGAGFLFLICTLHVRAARLLDVYYSIALIPVGLSLSFGLIIFGTFYSSEIVKKVIANPLIEFIGIISYSIYLWHFVIIKIIVFRFPSLNAQGLWPFILTTALAVVLSVMIGLSSYLAFERPFLKRRQKAA